MSLPPVISLKYDERRAEIRLSLMRDDEVFQGHFPNLPVLPGVVQIDWVMRLAQQCFPIVRPAADDFQVKFSRIIGPEAALVLVLVLEFDSERQRLTFEYRVGDQVMSAGRVTVETAP